jgi:hypothetical protein
MGILGAISNIFRKDTQVEEVPILIEDACCVDGQCTCGESSYKAPKEEEGASDCCVDDQCICGSIEESTTSSSTIVVESSDIESTTSSSTFTADEINIALETAAEADRLDAENYTPTPPPAPLTGEGPLLPRQNYADTPVVPPKKKRSKKASVKLNRKSTARKKKN